MWAEAEAAARSEATRETEVMVVFFMVNSLREWSSVVWR
jgi:hypothetical protein